MSKADELRRAGGGNAAESMGAGVFAAAPVHGARPAGVPGLPEHLRGVAKSKNVADVAVDRIVRDPDQPREEFDPEALERLAGSIRSRGQLQPIRVRWDEGRGSYVVVCGERRWRAANMAGLATVQCVIMDGPATPAELLALQVVENLLREDLRPVEQARAYRSMMQANGWTAAQLARELDVDHTGVSRALALLELPPAVQDRVERGELAPSVAYEVSKLEDPGEQADMVAQAVAGGLSRAEVAERVRRAASAKKGGRLKAKPRRTIATIRTPSGTRITLENRRGLDDAAIRTALAEALEAARPELAA